MKRILLSLTVFTMLATQAQAGALIRVVNIGGTQLTTRITSQQRLLELFTEELKIAQGHAQRRATHESNGLLPDGNAHEVREFAKLTTSSGVEVRMDVAWTIERRKGAHATLSFRITGENRDQVSSDISKILESKGSVIDRVSADGEERIFVDNLKDLSEKQIAALIKTIAREAKNDFKPAVLSRKSVSASSK